MIARGINIMAINNSETVQTITVLEDVLTPIPTTIPEMLHSTGDVLILTLLLTHCALTKDVYLQAIIRMPAWIFLAIICSNNFRLRDERCAALQELCRLGIIVYYGLKLNFHKISGLLIDKLLPTSVKGKAESISRKRDKSLSEDEVQRFYKGVPTLEKCNEPVSFCTLPYDKTLELSLNYFTIYKSQRNVTGHNGISFQGLLNWDKKKIKTVIKTNTPGDMQSLRGLMREIKLLKYVGQHDNLQTIFGACTKDINIGKIFLVLENCGSHTLAMHLQALRQEITGSPKLGVGANFDDLLVDFHRWAYEISSGLKFISSKGIVHGMLTCDTILLDEVGTVKLFEYGTASHLLDAEKLTPEQWNHDGWKYLAPEAITKNEFSTHSDVWSFAIVLWKIFTIYSDPYPAFDNYSKIFSLSLLDGMRPDADNRIPQHIFDFLGQCWRIEPEQRPTFDMCCQYTYIKTRPKRRIVTCDGDLISKVM